MPPTPEVHHEEQAHIERYTSHNNNQPHFRPTQSSQPVEPNHHTQTVAHKHSLSNSEQLAILRDAYARNPIPSRTELEALGRRTGRSSVKVREYFRQRRNKMRGLEDLAGLGEPSRATGW
jgi:hypothetical protein